MIPPACGAISRMRAPVSLAQASRPTAAWSLADLADHEDVLIGVDGAVRHAVAASSAVKQCKLEGAAALPAALRSRLLTYPHVSSRILSCRMLTYADVC